MLFRSILAPTFDYFLLLDQNSQQPKNDGNHNLIEMRPYPQQNWLFLKGADAAVG